MSGLLELGPEVFHVLKEFGANQWQYSLIGLLECGLGSSQMMEPGLEVDDGLGVLIERQEIGHSVQLLVIKTRHVQLLDSSHELILDDLLSKSGVVQSHVHRLGLALLFLSFRLKLGFPLIL